MNVQRYYAKALHVDFDALRRAQDAGDVLGAEAILQDAFETDVRPLFWPKSAPSWNSIRIR